jgi:hypothetical protein
MKIAGIEEDEMVDRMYDKLCALGAAIWRHDLTLLSGGFPQKLVLVVQPLIDTPGRQ